MHHMLRACIIRCMVLVDMFVHARIRVREGESCGQGPRAHSVLASSVLASVRAGVTRGSVQLFACCSMMCTTCMRM